MFLLKKMFLHWRMKEIVYVSNLLPENEYFLEEKPFHIVKYISHLML